MHPPAARGAGPAGRSRPLHPRLHRFRPGRGGDALLAAGRRWSWSPPRQAAPGVEPRAPWPRAGAAPRRAGRAAPGHPGRRRRARLPAPLAGGRLRVGRRPHPPGRPPLGRSSHPGAHPLAPRRGRSARWPGGTRPLPADPGQPVALRAPPPWVKLPPPDVLPRLHAHARLPQEPRRQRGHARHAHPGRLRLVPRPGPADVIVVNTCGFIDRAKEESVEAILETGAAQGARGGAEAGRGRLPRQRHHEELAPRDPRGGPLRRHRRLRRDRLHRLRRASRGGCVVPDPDFVHSASHARASTRWPATPPTSRSPRAATTPAPSASSRRCAGRSARAP